MPRLLAIGLNPALQKSLIFDHIRLGAVNRADGFHCVPGGKGYHFARAINTLHPGECTVAHFLGGDTGQFIEKFHDDLGIPQVIVRADAPTRTCTTVLEQGENRMTELIEPAGEIPPDVLDTMQRHLIEIIPSVDAIGLCGTFPPGVPNDFYAWVADHKGSATVLLDAYRGVQEVLATGKVDILKINLDELSLLTGMTDVSAAARRCFDRYGLRIIALTDGPGRAHLFAGDEHFVFSIPRLEVVANPIGAGDTVAGVFLSRLLGGASAPDAFADGLAAGTASCQHLEGAVFTLDELDHFRSAITIKAS